MAFLIILVFGVIIGIIFVNVSRTGSMRPVVMTTAAGLAVGLVISMVRVVPGRKRARVASVPARSAAEGTTESNCNRQPVAPASVRAGIRPPSWRRLPSTPRW